MTINNDNTLESDLASALEDNIRQWPLKTTEKAVDAIPVPAAPEADQEPRRAADQLGLALAGLLRMEEELAKLHEEIVGAMDEGAIVKPAADPSMPIIDRVRQDARSLAELALRLDRRIRFVREKL